MTTILLRTGRLRSSGAHPGRKVAVLGLRLDPGGPRARAGSLRGTRAARGPPVGLTEGFGKSGPGRLTRAAGLNVVAPAAALPLGGRDLMVLTARHRASGRCTPRRFGAETGARRTRCSFATRVQTSTSAIPPGRPKVGQLADSGGCPQGAGKLGACSQFRGGQGTTVGSGRGFRPGRQRARAWDMAHRSYAPAGCGAAPGARRAW